MKTFVLPADKIKFVMLNRTGMTLLALGCFFATALPTVNTHMSRIFEKLHVHSRSQAVAKFTHIPNAAVAKYAAAGFFQ